MVAGLADALLSPAGAAVVGCVGQSETTADLTPVLEVAVEDLIGQKLGDLRPNGLELGKLNRLRLYRVLGRCSMRGRIRCLERLDLLVHQQQALMLATDLLLQPGRQNASIAGTHLVQTRQEARLQGHRIADALAMQQPLDPVAVPGALLQQPLALAGALCDPHPQAWEPEPCCKPAVRHAGKPETSASIASDRSDRSWHVVP